jgi:hypothetical protein
MSILERIKITEFSMSAPIPKKMLEKLIEAGAVRRVQLRYVVDGWLITATTQAGEEILKQSDADGPRVFKTLNGAVAMLSDLGVRFIDMDLGPQPPARKNAAQKSLLGV